MQRTFCLVVAISLLSACTSIGITPIGSTVLSPLPPGVTVEVYSSEKEISAAFLVVGRISYTNPGKYQRLTLADVIPEIKDEARKAGANGVIIDETRAIVSGVFSRGIGVTGRAIAITPARQP